VKLAIGYPGEMHSVMLRAAESIFALERPDGVVIRWIRGNGWCQARRRNHVVEQAMAWGADRIVFLDLDQVYETDLLKRLIARQDELEAGEEILPPLAAMVPGRGYVKSSKMKPFQRLAWRMKDGEFSPVDTSEGEVIQADFPTCATVILDVKTFESLRKPWFYFKYKPEDWAQVHGEDAVLFLRIKRELGVDSYVDTTIKVGHMHQFVIDETYSERFADWALPGRGDPAICSYEGTKE